MRCGGIWALHMPPENEFRSESFVLRASPGVFLFLAAYIGGKKATYDNRGINGLRMGKTCILNGVWHLELTYHLYVNEKCQKDELNTTPFFRFLSGFIESMVLADNFLLHPPRNHHIPSYPAKLPTWAGKGEYSRHRTGQ